MFSTNGGFVKKFFFLIGVLMTTPAFAGLGYYASVRAGVGKFQIHSSDSFEMGPNFGVDGGVHFDERWSLGIHINYGTVKMKNDGTINMHAMPMMLDGSYVLNDTGPLNFYTGILIGQTHITGSGGLAQSSGFTVGAKFGGKSVLAPNIDTGPEFYLMNVFVPGTDYQLWGLQAVLTAHF
jgi:hypothetical protein